MSFSAIQLQFRSIDYTKKMDFLTLTLELFRNADHFIMYIAQTYGWWVYLVLFMIFYSETGIVICAFLPGDSLLLSPAPLPQVL